jgi:hypothetical protein
MAVADLAELAGVTPKTWHRWRDEGIRWQEADRVVASVLCDHLEWLYEADLLAEMDAAIGAVDALDDWPEDWPP